MASAYRALGFSPTKQESAIPTFNHNKAQLLHKLAHELSGGTVQLCIAFQPEEETAHVSFTLTDANGIQQTIRIHGEYFKLRDCISHHLGGRHV